MSIDGTGPVSYFRGGRALQSLWLAATAAGLALQPMTAILYLFARLERGGGEGLTDEERDDLVALRQRFTRIFKTAPGERAELMLFRLAVAGPPTARSLRRRLDDILTFA